MSTTSGKLSIAILEARFTRDVEVLGAMDPYVIIETRMQRIRTKTMTDAGKTPTWADEVAEIDVKYVGDDMQLSCLDENVMTSDEKIGEATIKISSLCIDGGLDEWFELHFKGKPAGHIHLKGQWVSNAEALKEINEEEMPAERPEIKFTNGEQAPPPKVEYQPYYRQPAAQVYYAQPVQAQNVMASPIYMQPMMMQQPMMYQQPMMNPQQQMMMQQQQMMQMQQMNAMNQMNQMQAGFQQPMQPNNI